MVMSETWYVTERDDAAADIWRVDHVGTYTVLLVRERDGLRRNVARDTLAELYSAVTR
jgi:hypothetical protein